MTDEAITQKLTTILYADVVGYSRLTGNDELGTHRVVMDVLDYANNTIVVLGGSVLRYAGDAILAEFPSVVSCVSAAVAVQTELAVRNQNIPKEQQVLMRIGINLGEVIEDRGEIYGDGVNVAARLESLAPPGGVCITGQVAEQIIGKLDARFGNAGRHKLKNIARPVEVRCWPAERAGRLRRATARQQWAIPLSAAAVVVVLAVLYMPGYLGEKPLSPTGPRIAVIPFTNLSSNQADVFFSDGLSKDINAQLSKFSNLFVFAPGSVSGFRDNPDCNTIRNELAADYILGGTVQRVFDKLRVTTTFTDAETCRQLDAPGPFDRDFSVANVLDIQLEIAKKVVAQVGSPDAPLYNVDVQSRIRGEAPETLQAYQCVLLSYWFYETFAPERLRKARACLENAVKTDPDYSLGWSRLAFVYLDARKYAIDVPPDWASLSQAASTRAIDIDPDNPDAYYALAILTQMTSQDRVEFQNFSERAVQLNPNDAFMLADLGTWMGYAGQWEQGKEWVAKSMLLNPKHQSWLHQVWHLDHYLKGEYKASRDVALKMNLPGNYMVQASLAAAYAMNGEQENAEKTLANVLGLRPDYADDPRKPFRARGMPVELIESLMDGLRIAGLDVKPEK